MFKNLSVVAFAIVLIVSGCTQTQPAGSTVNACEQKAHTTDPTVFFCDLKDGKKCCNFVETNNEEQNRAQEACDCDGDNLLDNESLRSDPLCQKYYASAPSESGTECNFTPTGTVSNSSSGQVDMDAGHGSSDSGSVLDRCDPRNGSVPVDCPGQNGNGSSSGGNANSASASNGGTSSSAAQNASSSAAVGATSMNAGASSGQLNPCDPANGSVPPSCNVGGSSSAGNAASSSASSSSSGGPAVCNVQCNTGEHCVILSGGVLACVSDAAGSSSSSAAQSSSSSASASNGGLPRWEFMDICGAVADFTWPAMRQDGIAGCIDVNLCTLRPAYVNGSCAADAVPEWVGSDFNWILFPGGQQLIRPSPFVQQPGVVLMRHCAPPSFAGQQVRGTLMCAPSASNGWASLNEMWNGNNREWLVQDGNANTNMAFLPQAPQNGSSSSSSSSSSMSSSSSSVSSSSSSSSGGADGGVMNDAGTVVITPTECIASGAPFCLDPDTVGHPGAVLFNPVYNAGVEDDVKFTCNIPGHVDDCVYGNGVDVSPTHLYGPVMLRFAPVVGQSTVRVINPNGLYANIMPACDAMQYTGQSGCYLPFGGSYPFGRWDTELVNGKFVTSLLGGREPGAGQGVQMATVYGVDAQGGPPCMMSTQECRDAKEVFGIGANFPQAFLSVPSGVDLARYLIVYKDGCRPGVYCPDPSNPQIEGVPVSAGAFTLYVTSDNLFDVGALGSDGIIYMPSKSNWYTDDHPFFAGATRVGRVHYQTFTSTGVDYLDWH